MFACRKVLKPFICRENLSAGNIWRCDSFLFSFKVSQFVKFARFKASKLWPTWDLLGKKTGSVEQLRRSAAVT